ncbi:hypothetical protein R3P38DRAFT_2790699 [Favolaschia claudopus]|uniref:Uncharacterized protein n=1 Tax=Favolaschia claudopus TaxID=2862362 RepID=A0AAW0AI52_9AGAR
MTRTWTSPYAIKVQRKMFSKELQAMGIPSAQVFIAMANSQSTMTKRSQRGQKRHYRGRDVFESQEEAYECFYTDESLWCDSDIQTTRETPRCSSEASPRVGLTPVLEHHQEEHTWAIISHADLEIAGDNPSLINLVAQKPPDGLWLTKIRLSASQHTIIGKNIKFIKLKERGEKGKKRETKIRRIQDMSFGATASLGHNPANQIQDLLGSFLGRSHNKSEKADEPCFQYLSLKVEADMFRND